MDAASYSADHYTNQLSYKLITFYIKPDKMICGIQLINIEIKWKEII